MFDATWEDMISLNSRTKTTGEPLGPPREYLGQDIGEVAWDRRRIPIDQALATDTSPLPTKGLAIRHPARTTRGILWPEPFQLLGVWLTRLLPTFRVAGAERGAARNAS